VSIIISTSARNSLMRSIRTIPRLKLNPKVSLNKPMGRKNEPKLSRKDRIAMKAVGALGNLSFEGWETKDLVRGDIDFAVKSSLGLLTTLWYWPFIKLLVSCLADMVWDRYFPNSEEQTIGSTGG